MFELKSPYLPCGDQPRAIRALSDNLKRGVRHQVLLGVTGSGKTFTISNVIAKANKPTLVISPNKVLAAQLYGEFREFFPRNAVEYFVSYYDYYQPEAYLPITDTYIEKDASINDRLDRLRLSATSSLLSRRDVVVVASVSCIYNLGSPDEYKNALVFVGQGEQKDRDWLLGELTRIQYERNDTGFCRGKFRVRGDSVDVFPAYRETFIRIEFGEEKIARITEVSPLNNSPLRRLPRIGIFPAKHFVASEDRLAAAISSIEKELQRQIDILQHNNQLLEAQRLERRTKYDMEMLREVGYCHGIENYSRHLSGRAPGSRPPCLIDYFPDDFLLIVDESHITLPQIRGMFAGDKARKDILVEYGFRLPSCLDNRPLKFCEFEAMVKQAVYVSATPSKEEIGKSRGRVIQQVIRPTGLVDPRIEVRKSQGQVKDLIAEVKRRAAKNERALVTTLTKRMAEDLCVYLKDKKLRVKYLHSDVKTLDRSKILRELREKRFDCLVGINLLREGLDLPEVSLVAIIDADKEGFLRSETSLIQTAGRAARNINGLVIMYADRVTGSMRRAIQESLRRRRLQIEFNRRHKIAPRSIDKAIREGLRQWEEARDVARQATGLPAGKYERAQILAELEREMEVYSRNLQFEKAIEIREKIKTLS
ncbi:MAG: excinuclease ABC subunit UvrB, partial [Candidatus Omnitrophota bacterium]